MVAKRSQASRKSVEQPAEAAFDMPALLAAAGIGSHQVTFAVDQTLYVQGAPADSVFYLVDGNVKKSVISAAGKEAIVGMLSGGDFVGEGCLAGQATRMGSATAVTPTVAIELPKAVVARLLRDHEAFTVRFMQHVLSRGIRIEEDLIDQLFNSSEKRLARTLLLLARYGESEQASYTMPRLSQETLAEMIGTTRSRVNYFMNKFRELGFIEYNGGLKINDSLLRVVLRD